MACNNYSPSWLHMGDCLHCGHTEAAHRPDPEFDALIEKTKRDIAECFAVPRERFGKDRNRESKEN